MGSKFTQSHSEIHTPMYKYVWTVELDVNLVMFMVLVDGLLTCSSAATMYIESTGSTAPFIVMETDIFSSGMPSNKICSGRGKNGRG